MQNIRAFEVHPAAVGCAASWGERHASEVASRVVENTAI